VRDHDLRERLALACRLLHHEGHEHFYLGHLSARASEDGLVWVKPGGLGLEEVVAEDMLLMDLDGRLVEGTRRLHNEMPIHTEIYKHRADVQAIAHTHPFFASALASTNARVEMVSQDSIFFARGVGVYPSAELVTTVEQGQRLALALGDLRAVLLRNHGIAVAGDSIEHATILAISLERSCRLQVAAAQLGELAPIPPEQVERMQRGFEEGYAGRNQALWSYLVRKLARETQ
jgi:L-fuculose-phosphate aldolase